MTINTAPTNFNIKIGTAQDDTRRYVEYLSNYDFGTSVADAFFVDSGLTYSGSSANQITGLDHLEGESVSIWQTGQHTQIKLLALGLSI